MASESNNNNYNNNNNNNNSSSSNTHFQVNKSHPSYLFLKTINEYPPSFLQYYRLWLQTKAETDNINTEYKYEPSYIENVYWSSLEKERFFTAIERCGPRNYEEIQSRIGPTKTVLQVQIYAEYLKIATEIELKNKDDNREQKIPFANEMTDQWIEKEENLAQDLSSFIDHQANAIDLYNKSKVYGRKDIRRYAHQLFINDSEFKLVKLRKDQQYNDFDHSSDYIFTSRLSSLASKYNQHAIVTEETKLILHKLLIRFLKDAMINLACLHRRRNANGVNKKAIVTKSHVRSCIPKKYSKKYGYKSDIFDKRMDNDNDDEMDDAEDTYDDEEMDDDDETNDDETIDETPYESKIKGEEYTGELLDDDGEDGDKEIRNDNSYGSIDEHLHENKIKGEMYTGKLSDIGVYEEVENIINNSKYYSKYNDTYDEKISLEKEKQLLNTDDEEDEDNNDQIPYKKEINLLNSSDDDTDNDDDYNSNNDSNSEDDDDDDDDDEEMDDETSSDDNEDDENIDESEIVFIYKKKKEEKKEEEEYKNFLATEHSSELAMIYDDLEVENTLNRIMNH